MLFSGMGAVKSAVSIVYRKCIFACASLPLLHDFQSSFILLRIDFKPQNYFRVAACFSQILFVSVGWNGAKSRCTFI